MLDIMVNVTVGILFEKGATGAKTLGPLYELTRPVRSQEVLDIVKKVA